MRNLCKVVALAAAPVLTAVQLWAAPAATSAPKLYSAPSGRIVYRTTSSGAMATSSTVTMTWVDYGRRFRQDTQSRINMPGGGRNAKSGKPATMNTWMICDGTNIYSAMPGSGGVIRMPIPQRKSGQAAGMDALQRMGLQSRGVTFKVVGRETLLGKPATISSVTMSTANMKGSGKVWTWGNLALRMEMTMKYTGQARRSGRPGQPAPRQMPPMTMKMVATSLDLKIKPPASLFKLPAGSKVESMDELQKRMMGRMRSGRMPRR